MRRFSPGWIPTVAMIVAVAVLCALGVWQLRRHQWREALLAEQQARLELPPVPVAEAIRDPDAYQWRRATARGRYDRDHTIVVQHVRRGLREGAQVLTPLLREDAGTDTSGASGASDASEAPGALEAPAVLIDRGWVPYREQDRFLPEGARLPDARPTDEPTARPEPTAPPGSPASGDSSALPEQSPSRGPAASPEAASPEPPPPADPSDLIEVTGVVRPMDLGDARPGTAAEPRTAWLRFNPADPTQPAALQSQLPYRLAPLLLQRQPETGPADAAGEPGAVRTTGADAAPRARDRTPAQAPQLPIATAVQPESPVNHLAYAFQWFAFAAIALATWIGLGLKHARESSSTSRPSQPGSS